MDIRTDLHSHTIASGHAFSTFGEMAQEAANRGLELVAVTDHGPSMQGAPHDGYFTMAKRIPRRWHGVAVLFGCEANILSPEGELDLSPDILSMLDVVGAGLHERTPYPATKDIEANTRALVAVCGNPHVDVIVHPYRPPFPVDVEEVAEAAAATGTLLEVNASLFRPLLHSRAAATVEVVRETRRMVRALARHGGRCVVSSDAHHAGELGFEARLTEFLTDILEVTPELVVNQDADAVIDHLRIDVGRPS